MRFTGLLTEGGRPIGYTSLDETVRVLLSTSQEFRNEFFPDPSNQGLKINVPFTPYKL